MTQINKPSLYFNTKLYTGNGGTQAITGVGHQPDFVWIKSRGQGDGHKLFDAVRGVLKVISSNETDAESTYANSLTAFGTDGFTLGSTGDVNDTGDTFVSWNWKANGTGSSNSDGSITSTVSVSQTSGFSIVKYAGAAGTSGTVGHGLNAVPKIIFLKDLAANNWNVYNFSSGNTKYLQLNENIQPGTASNRWNNTTPTSSVFTVGNDDSVNNSGRNFVAYCFAEKPGFSKINTYVGKGNDNGTFVYTGFKPAFVLIKPLTVTDGWTMSDIARDTAVDGGNGTGARVLANESSAEATNATWAAVNKYSNGFKVRGTDNVSNATDIVYLYLAFAKEPLVGTNNVCSTAN